MDISDWLAPQVDEDKAVVIMKTVIKSLEIPIPEVGIEEPPAEHGLKIKYKLRHFRNLDLVVRWGG